MIYGMDLTQGESFDAKMDPFINHEMEIHSPYICVYGIDSAFMTEFDENGYPIVDEDKDIYPLIIRSETRTVIKSSAKNGSKWEYDYSIIPKALEEEEEQEGETVSKYTGTKKYVQEGSGSSEVNLTYPVVWIGYYGKVEKDTASEPHFVKTYLVKYEAQNLYLADGDVTDKVFTPTFEDTTKYLQADIYNETDLTTSYAPINVTYTGLKGNDFITGSACYGCVPGYQCDILTPNEGENEQEIITEPLINSQTKDLQMKRVSVDGETPINSAKVIITGPTKIIKGREYTDKDNVVQKPKLALLYNYEATDVIDGILKKNISATICSKMQIIDGFLIEGPIDVYKLKNGGADLTTAPVKLRYLSNVGFRNCTLRDVKKDISTVAIEYFWLYNVLFENCENSMKYYKIAKTIDFQLIGGEEENQMVGENGQGVLKPFFRGQSLGVSAYSPANQQMFFASLDDLYGWLMQTHRVSCKKVVNETTDYYSIQYPEIILDETSAEKGTYTLKFFVESSDKVLYYNKGSPCKFVIKKSTEKTANDLETAIVYELSKKIDSAASKSSGRYDTVKFHLCWKVDKEEGSDYTTGTGDNKKYRCDTYYGLIGSDYFGELSEIFLKVNKVETVLTPSSNPTETETVIKPNSSVTQPEPEVMTEYLTKLKKILEIMPINTTYIGEAVGAISKYVLFETARLPSYVLTKKPTITINGLDKNHEPSVIEAKKDAYDSGLLNSFKEVTVDGETKYIGTLESSRFVTQQYYCAYEEKGVEDGEFMWAVDPQKDEYSHNELCSDIAAAFEVLNWMCMGENAKPEPLPAGTKAGSVEEELYVMTRSIINNGIKYYGQSTPSTKSELTASMVDLAELEIYEEEAIYQVHYALTEDNNEIVVGLSVNGQKGQSGQDLVKPFVEGFLTDISKDIKNYLEIESSPTYTLDEFVAYLKPNCSKDVTKSERNRLIEYSQMLNTIQGQRDFIQKKGEKEKNFLLKFQQMSKGTIFEILKGEGDNYLESENIYGYYISQGYGYTGTSDNVIKVPKGRKERRIHGDKGIIPTLQTSNPVRYRITRMPEYYSQEPLDWRNDNYFSNQIYTLNADNLNTMIDPEFEAREKTIYTKPDSTGTTPKYEEQEMIGFYTILVKEN